jgi:hypothetical protein
MKRLAKLLGWAFAGVFTVIAALALWEVFIFISSDEASALKLANREFVSVCAREKLNSNDFKAPERVMRKDRAYEFVWRNPTSGDEILALTSYLPEGAEAWLVRGEEIRSIKERFHLK